MAINCEKCKYFDEDYIFDEETGDEFPFFSCDKNHNDELNDDCICPYFKKFKLARHVEQDTKCDKCEYLQECIYNGRVIDCKNLEDMRGHYIKSLCSFAKCDGIEV